MRASIKEFVTIAADTLPVLEPLYEFGALQVTGQSLGMVVPLVVAKFFSPDFVWRLLPKKADILRR
jgi:hypothetical protein